jgi:alpha-glucosidase (family GH31 glycosyl hydrolase)
MDRYRDFTFDPVNFAGLKDFVGSLQSAGKHFIPILDAGIAKRPNANYSVYDDGVANDVFIKNHDGSIFTG